MQNVTGQISSIARQVTTSVEQVIVGKSSIIEAVLVAILCEGHVLLEDVPGIGKTLLARSVARSLGCGFRRLQCTPDILPSDITGTYIFNQKTGDFELRQGPVFTQIFLVDEINRATPRTQSAMLEAMQERQVTLEGETRALPRPFLVLATQNPIELEGTFPLPEAQLDRFLIRLRMGYPTKDEDAAILERFMGMDPIVKIQPVISAEDLLQLQAAVRSVQISAAVRGYIIEIIHATRSHSRVELGASPRAMLALAHAAQALAAIRGREYVIPDNVKYLAPLVLEHRLILRAQSSLRGMSAADILREVMGSVPVPVEDEAAPAGQS